MNNIHGIVLLSLYLNADLIWHNHLQNDHDQSEHQDEDDLDDDEHKLSQNPAPEYKRLIAISAGKPKGGLKEALRGDPDKVKRLSLSEQELEKVSLTQATDIVR